VNIWNIIFEVELAFVYSQPGGIPQEGNNRLPGGIKPWIGTFKLLGYY